MYAPIYMCVCVKIYVYIIYIRKKAESWRIDAFELWCWRRLLRVPWTARRSIQPVHPKGNQSWIFIGRTDAEAETPILWPPDAKNWLIGKDPDTGKDWRQEEKGTTEDEMVEWHHQLDGHEFEQAVGIGDGQGNLVCSSPWGCKGSVTTEQLNQTNIYYVYVYVYITYIYIIHVYILPTKVRVVKAMVFPVVMYGCESWTIKKDEHQRIDAFELWCWRRLLRVPWTARRSNQSILKEISPEYSLEGLMLKLKSRTQLSDWTTTKYQGGFHGGSAVKNLPAMQELQETWVWSLCWKDPLEEGMATHSRILAWRIPWTEELGGLLYIVLQRVGLKQLRMQACAHTHTHTHTHTHKEGEGKERINQKAVGF